MSSDPTNGVRKAVVLFDIDGTLIRRAGPHHRQALEEAVLEVTGRKTTTDGIPVQGMLDRDILATMLKASGASGEEIKASMAAIVARAQELYQDLCPDLSDKACPGSLVLLRDLQRERIPAGLVTGNLTAIAWKKMEAAGLRPYLQFGAFAEMGETRGDLAALALAQARAAGWVSEHTVISLIGDHPNDVAAAKLNKLRSVAVCTGVVPRAELEAAGPDLVVEDLTMLHLRHLLE